MPSDTNGDNPALGVSPTAGSCRVSTVVQAVVPARRSTSGHHITSGEQRWMRQRQIDQPEESDGCGATRGVVRVS